MNLTRPIAAVDLETTGVDIEQDRIIEIGIVRTDEVALQSLVFPGRPIPEAASAVNGIHDEDVQGAPTFEDLAPRILEVLDGCDIVTYNGRTFDVPMLSAEFKRVGITWPPPDMVQIDVRRVWERQEPRTLAAAVTRWLGIAEYDGHRAIADASKTLAVLQEMAAQFDVRDVDGLVALERAPDWYDDEGKLRIADDGSLVMGFGKWLGKPLSMVETGYLRWMADGNFSAQVKSVVIGILNKRVEEEAEAFHARIHRSA